MYKQKKHEGLHPILCIIIWLILMGALIYLPPWPPTSFQRRVDKRCTAIMEWAWADGTAQAEAYKLGVTPVKVPPPLR